jgi:hypothetical protein
MPVSHCSNIKGSTLASAKQDVPMHILMHLLPARGLPRTKVERNVAKRRNLLALPQNRRKPTCMQRSGADIVDYGML